MKTELEREVDKTLAPELRDKRLGNSHSETYDLLPVIENWISKCEASTTVVVGRDGIELTFRDLLVGSFALSSPPE